MCSGVKKILVVDDEKELTAIMSQALSSWGRMSIVQADSVDKALEILRQQHIDLVLTDIKMKDKSGYDLLNEIRVTDKKLPFIMISGQTNIYDDNRCSPEVFKSIYAFLEKPLKLAHLKATISKALADSQNQPKSK